MPVYNLNSLLHRSFSWTATLPDGSVTSGTSLRDIPVRVPRIQRDYAEGRDSEMIERKRHNLLNDMLDVVYGSRPGLSFDFVYGYIVDGGRVVDGDAWTDARSCPNPFFEPLDGQQRLTTLFLFHWLFGRAADLRGRAGHSLLVYETRDTSEEFCDWLVGQDAVAIVGGWRAVVEAARRLNAANKQKWTTEKNADGVIDPFANRLRFPLVKAPSLFEYMQSIDSFKWDWHDDPNIHSMITVLESAVNYIRERGLAYTDGVGSAANLDNITFMLLDNLRCDGDQLFEKMNARGKALTSFEILKSSLEEEMERQDLPSSAPALTTGWRNAVDGDWLDFCWDISNIGDDPRLSTVRSVEERLERLLIRMAGKSFFTKQITGTPRRMADAIDYTERFAQSIAGGDDVNDVIDRYLEYARHERSMAATRFTAIDFREIFADINNLIFCDSGRWHDASTLLPRLNRLNSATLLEEFMRDTPTHNIRVMAYAMLAYLRIVPARVLCRDPKERSEFVEWMRFIRNVYNSDNKVSGLDNFNDVKMALKAIDSWLDTYRQSYWPTGQQAVLRLIVNHIKGNPLSQEQARLDEEAIKASLRINGTQGVAPARWESSILRAEDNVYLWGQIIAPLSWAAVGTTYDKDLFDTYVDRLDMIMGSREPDSEPTDALLIQAMLCLDDYRHNLKQGLGSLGRLNNNRDYSWKQYLRKPEPSTGYYGALFKRLIDRWLSTPALTFDALLRQVIGSHKGAFTISDWRYYIVNISEPDTLLKIFRDVQTYGRYVYVEPGGHAYLFRSNTLRTACRYELVTTYLSYETSLHRPGVKSARLAHTAEESGACVDFTVDGGDVIRLSAASGDLYDISRQSAGTETWQQLSAGLGIADVETRLRGLDVIERL